MISLSFRECSLAGWCAQQQLWSFQSWTVLWENLGEPLRFSYLLGYFSFWTFSHRELFCTALGAYHCMVQAVRSCFWGDVKPPHLWLSILCSRSSGTCSSVLDTYLPAAYPNLHAELRAPCLRTDPCLLFHYLLLCLGDYNSFVCRIKCLIVTPAFSSHNYLVYVRIWCRSTAFLWQRCLIMSLSEESA